MRRANRGADVPDTARADARAHRRIPSACERDPAGASNDPRDRSAPRGPDRPLTAPPLPSPPSSRPPLPPSVVPRVDRPFPRRDRAPGVRGPARRPPRPRPRRGARGRASSPGRPRLRALATVVGGRRASPRARALPPRAQARASPTRRSSRGSRRSSVASATSRACWTSPWAWRRRRVDGAAPFALAEHVAECVVCSDAERVIEWLRANRARLAAPALWRKGKLFSPSRV